MKIISNITDRLRKYLRVDTDRKAGVYLTLIFHLAVIIVLLCWSIHRQLAEDSSFVIDFSAQEAQEAVEARARMQESVSEETERRQRKRGNMRLRMVSPVAHQARDLFSSLTARVSSMSSIPEEAG